ncbi:MAG: hypothetical protein ABJF01_16230 [bacterium]
MPASYTIDLCSAFSPGVRRAFVTRNAVQFGMARMFAAHAESAHQLVRVFRDTGAALDWLTESSRGAQATKDLL